MKAGEVVVIVYWIAIAVIMAVYIWVGGVNFWTNTVLLAVVILGMLFSVALLTSSFTLAGHDEKAIARLVSSVTDREVIERLDKVEAMVREVREAVDAIRKALEE